MAVASAFQKMRVTEAQKANIDQTLVISEDEVLTFTESLRELYEAGVPINEILRQLQQATTNKKFARALGLMVDDIENGKLLSETLARFPNSFGEDYRALVRAAEQSGKWTRKRDKYGEIREGILDMLIAYIKRRNSARERVKSGFVYPGIIAIAICVALLVFGFYVLPVLRSFFTALGNQENTWFLTKMLFSFSDLAQKYWYLPPIIAVFGGYFLWAFWKSEKGKMFWMSYQLRMRKVGPIFVQMHVGEVTWLMGTLFSAGLTPQEVLDILCQSVRNVEIAKALELAKEYLYQGISFCDALRKAHWVFDGQTYMVLSTAQKSGRLGVALQNYASQLFEKLDQNIDKVVKFIEPLLICIAGVIIGFIAIAFYGGISNAISNIPGTH